MNYIFMTPNCMSAITDSVDEKSHKHAMLQLFISYEHNLTININNDNIDCKCIIVNSNVPHTFITNDTVHFTMLIDPTSNIAKQFKDKFLKNKHYYIFKFHQSNFLQLKLKKLMTSDLNEIDRINYNVFLQVLFNTLDIKYKNGLVYDERILYVLKKLDECDCCEHSIKKLAKEILLTESRLSHLFKKETGIALNNYIILHKLQKTYMYLCQGLNVTDASFAAGFESSSHFSYNNKKFTGMTARNIVSNSVFLKVFNFYK